MKRSIWFYSAAGLTLLLLGGFFYLARSVAVPFLLALILAYFLDPPVDFLEGRRVPRTLAVCLVFAGFSILLAAGLVFLVPALQAEILQVKKSLPGYADKIYGLVPEFVLNGLGITGGEDLQGLFDRGLDLARNLSFDVVNQVAIFLSRAFSSTFSFLMAVLGYFIIPVYLFYLLRDFDRLKGGVMELVPPQRRTEILSLGRDVDSVLAGFIRGQLLVCLILGALYSLGLHWIGIDLALVIGLLSGLAYIVPYLGTLIGIVVAGIMAVVKFHDFLHPALVVAWFSLVQGLEGTVITPRIVGNRVGLHPVATILAVLIGGDLFGFLGLLLAVPVTASGKVVLLRLVRRYQESRWYALPEEGEARAGDS